MSEEEVNKLDLSSISDDELQSIVRRKLLGGTQKQNDHKLLLNQKQKVVSVNETNKYLDQGWEYVAKLSEDMVIIKNTPEV